MHMPETAHLLQLGSQETPPYVRCTILNSKSAPSGTSTSDTHTWPSVHAMSGAAPRSHAPRTGWLPTTLSPSPKAACRAEESRHMCYIWCVHLKLQISIHLRRHFLGLRFKFLKQKHNVHTHYPPRPKPLVEHRISMGQHLGLCICMARLQEHATTLHIQDPLFR